MIIAGAGGHALELLDILISEGKTEGLCYFDQVNPGDLFLGKYPILHKEEEIAKAFLNDPRFILGTGNPKVRYQFYQRFTSLGGVMNSVKGRGIAISIFSTCNEADIFDLCFIGSNSRIGKGCLINTGAQIHHEVEIGEFSELNPGAVLLGKVQIGSFCSIGANATILPKVKIGDNVIVGAGSVVTKDVPDGVTVLGVPGRVIRDL